MRLTKEKERILALKIGDTNVPVDLLNDIYADEEEKEAEESTEVTGEILPRFSKLDAIDQKYLYYTAPEYRRDYTLAEVYGIYGLDYLRDKISSMTGLEIDYYTAINAIDLPSVASAIGDIHIDVPVEIGFNGKEYVTYVKPPETEAAETKKPKPDDEKKDEETEADTEAETEAETEPVIEIEVEAENGFKDPKKLHAVMLYSDYSDGIEHESAIINGFVASVLNNISSSSDNSLENIIRGLEKKMTTNITAEDIALNGDVVRAYSWLGKQYVVYPGRLVSASANKDAFYLPDVNEAMEFFYKYR
jgi:hypothetical protein